MMLPCFLSRTIPKSCDFGIGRTRLTDYHHGGVLAVNPASAVRGSKYVITNGKTPVLTPTKRGSC